jgi:hypothetical protein
LTNVIDVDGGASHVCAVLSDGTTHCLGAGLGIDAVQVRERISNNVVVGIEAIELGYFRNGVMIDGMGGLLAINDGAIYDIDTSLAIFAPVSAASLGDGFQCEVPEMAPKIVACFGSNSLGQLGDGTAIDRPTRMEAATVLDASGDMIDTAVDVELGLSHACVLLSDGSVKCWGAGVWSQLGDGEALNRPNARSMRTTTGAPISNITAVSTGALFTCTLDADGNIWGTGSLGGTPLDYRSFARRLTSRP